MHSDNERVVQRFNEGINNRNINLIANLMTDDHSFVDAASNTLQGKEGVLEAWNGFFNSYPDYRNIFESLVSKDDTVTIIGRSTCSDGRLDGPAIWTAKINGNKVAEWRMYDDTPANRRLVGI